MECRQEGYDAAEEAREGRGSVNRTKTVVEYDPHFGPYFAIVIDVSDTTTSDPAEAAMSVGAEAVKIIEEYLR